MYRFGAFHSGWLTAALVFLAVGIFVATCRRAFERFSRRRFLDHYPVDRRDAMESFLAQKDDLERTLERLDSSLRCAVVCCLTFGRLLWLDSQAGPQGRLGLTEQGVGTLTLVTSILVVELAAMYLVFFELVPSVIGRVAPEGWLARFRGAIDWIHRLTEPVRWALARGVYLLSGLLGGNSQRSEADIFEEEILEKVEEGEREGLLESNEGDMIESIIEFGDVEVSEVMTPRTEMVCLDLAEPLQKNLDRAIECGYSRIPVFLDHKDHIVGVLYVKDVLRKLYRGQEIVLDSLVRKPYCVPVTKKIDEVLQELKQHRLQIAIVLDEHGGTDGVVTVEDILEEIVGEISDEYEKEETATISHLSDCIFVVDAAVHVDDLNEELSLDLPENENYDTIGGFLFARMGRIPGVGDDLEVDGVRFEVTRADERRVLRLHVHLPEATGKNGEAVVGME